ncbi:transmembrane protein 223-like, partial [Empidonax traillii]|uniref:transmembrane protein 223-like n=1 Tax=Empidonax traillii TaxID=164674 RepID=UPI000FFDABF8
RVPAGSLTVAAGWLCPLRVVRRVTLLRGGSRVTLQTHGPLGLGSGETLTVPLRDVSARAHRAEAAAAVPVRVRGRPFFFLLDKRGLVGDPWLFDLTVGAYRKF